MDKSVVIRKGREKSIQRRHPWVFSGSLHSLGNGVEDGDVVCVKDKDGSVLGMGHYQAGSLALKMLCFEKRDINQQWFNERIQLAFSHRQALNLPNEETNAFRLIHGEGDGLPGLIIDVYADVAVIQPHSIGMERSISMISEALRSLDLTLSGIVHKPLSQRKAEVVSGEVSERTRISEEGILYNVDVLFGQKTGFFLDQRNNRSLVRMHSDGANVLNVFSYTGGFSLSAIKGGAQKAVSLDSSAQVLDVAEENAMLNEMNDRHEIVKADAIPYLNSLTESYDVIILDPPAFAKHKSARHNAIKAYSRINQAALSKVNKGGLLFTFSCSQVVDRGLFEDAVRAAAIQSGREIQILQTLRQPEDHPVSIYHPEGDYLKGLMLRVD